jgi:hypothetical protein
MARERRVEAGKCETSTGRKPWAAGRADNKAYHRDDVGDTVARINDGAGEGALAHVAGGPRRGQCQHSLHGNVEPRNCNGQQGQRWHAVSHKLR